MAKPKAAAKKAHGKRAMARSGAKPKPAPKANPSSNARTSRAGHGEQTGQALPTPAVSLAATDTLVALLTTIAQKLDRVQATMEQQDGPQRDAAPPAPSPNNAAFALPAEFVAETQQRMRRIEDLIQQHLRDPRRDVPLSVVQQKVMFAGACKTLGITQPTPAIIGRIMHDKRMFSPADDKSPRSLLEAIYAKPNIADHLSQEIRKLLGQYGNESSQTNTATNAEATSPHQQEKPKKRPKAPSSTIAKKLGPEFDKRFALIENTGLGKKEPVKAGQKTNYRRYLLTPGRELFNGWPDWTDATGGVGLADEQVRMAPSQPERTGPDDGATQPPS